MRLLRTAIGKLVAIALGLCVVAIIAAVVNHPRMMTAATRVVALTSDVHQSWAVSVNWSLTLNDSNQLLYEHMATVLSGVTAVPVDRLNCYSATVNQDGYSIVGWSGMVGGVISNIDGTFTILVSATPLVMDEQGGGGTTLFGCDYSEQYLVDQQDNVTYLGFERPLAKTGGGQLFKVIF